MHDTNTKEINITESSIHYSRSLLSGSDTDTFEVVKWFPDNRLRLNYQVKVVCFIIESMLFSLAGVGRWLCHIRL